MTCALKISLTLLCVLAASFPVSQGRANTDQVDFNKYELDSPV